MSGTGTGVEVGGDIVQLITGVDLGVAKTSVAIVVRALGFGPEADAIATVLVGIFAVIMVVGYIAGAKDLAASKPAESANTTTPVQAGKTEQPASGSNKPNA